jgi:hypothetical protein
MRPTRARSSRVILLAQLLFSPTSTNCHFSINSMVGVWYIYPILICLIAVCCCALRCYVMQQLIDLIIH